jgi:hypothetical protein
VAKEEGSERAGDLVMIRHKKNRPSDEDEGEERLPSGDDPGPGSAG